MRNYEQLIESCRRAGRARMTSLTAEKRKEVASLGGVARVKKYFSDPRRILNIQNTSRRLKISTIEVLRLVQAGQLFVTEYGNGGAMRFSVAEIERYKQTLCN